MSGIYFHIPFCKQKCTYCDFHFSTNFSSYRQRMIDCMIKELELRGDYLQNKDLQSVYFGGGTPSLLTETELRILLEKVSESYNLFTQTEFTLETNPDDITPEALSIWSKLGINRLSIGLQSFKTEDLKWMNRAHTVDQSLSCVKLAQEYGFENISVDLIYGLPDLSLKEWEQHIDRVLEMNVQHVSAYCLTIEEKTVLHNWVQKKKIKPAGEDDQSEQFLLLSEKLKNAGFDHYEISNFGLPGLHAVHNSNYWKGEHYLGIGPSAHSFDGKTRRWNISNNSFYIKNIGENNTWFEEEELTYKERWNELILTGLRTSYGLPIEKLKEIQEPGDEFNSLIQNFREKNWMLNEENTLVLTEEGRLRADYIASELFL